MNVKLDKDKIHKLMQKKGIATQKDLAKKMGITPNELSRLLSPKYCPIKNNVNKLVTILGNEAISAIEPIISKQKELFDLGNDTKFPQKTIDVSKIKSSKKYKNLEIFAGAGGLALGLDLAGFSSVGLIEFDKDAAATLRINRKSWNVIEEDVIKVTESKNGIWDYIKPNQEIDLVSGGFPCQSFSYAGKRLGLNDTRGTLFYYYAKILKQIMPKMFLVENVKGLTTLDHGKTLKTMIKVFEDLGYTTTYRILNAWDHGVAEKRERMILIGIRNDLDIKYFYPKKHLYKPVLKDILMDVPKSEGQKYSEKKKKIMDLVPAGEYWRSLPEDLAKEYMGASYYSGGGRTCMARRLSWNEPSLTLTTSPSQKQTERCHPSETRPFTTREYARIQSFPDNWKFSGTMNSIYKQIGNAVPVNLAKDVGLSIINSLNMINK